MNYKPWQWRKTSSEKTMFGMYKSTNSRTIKEEGQKLLTHKEAGLEKSSKSLNEKLASVLLDCHNEGNPSIKQSHMMSQEGIAGEKKEKIVGKEEDLGKEVSRDNHEKIHEGLELKLRETGRRLDDLTIKNTHLTSALISKGKYIEELLQSKDQVDGEFITLMARLDSMEKENAFLRYEFQMIEKELEIRKEEMEYSRQFADASHIQYLESQQKASKLEAECQRLRLLLQKKSTGSSTDASEMSISSMIKCLQDLDEENKVLKRILTEKNTELDSSRLMYAQMASRLSQAEILLRKHFEEYKSNMSGSWEDALVSELLRTEGVRYQKDNRDTEGPDSNSPENYVEMEKRAVVSVDTPKRGQCSESDIMTGREIVPLEQDFHFSDSKQETQFKYETFEESSDWIQIVLNAIFKQERISKRSLDELFEDIKTALGRINHQTACNYKENELKTEESVKKNLENVDLNQQLQEAKSKIEVLRSELEAMKESKGIVEDQFEKQKLINEDLDTQLTIAHTKLNDVFQKFSSLEVELEDKKISCEELEATCLELQLQLESIVKKESPTPGRDEMEKIYQTRWEITTASSKLAECQGTIINLGKQLKSLASSSEAALFERIMAINNSTQKKNLIRRSSLRSQMQADDESKEGIFMESQVEDNKTSEDVKKIPIFDHSGSNGSFLKALNDMAGEPKKELAGAKAIVKTKKQGAFDFLRKLLLRKMKFGKRK